MADPLRIIPTPHFLPYANLSTPIVCATADPSGFKRNAVGIDCATDGTAVLRPRGGPSDGSKDRTIQLLAGQTRWFEFDQAVSGTALNVVIYWPPKAP